MTMLDRLLNQVNILEKGLDASWLKNDVIAGNIANADTPEYKSRTVSFTSMFRDALAEGSAAAAAPAAYSTFLDSVQAPSAPMTDTDSLQAQVVVNDRTSLRMDGNNVDIDYEMTELAKNSSLYDTLSYAAAKEIGRLKLIISEGK